MRPHVPHLRPRATKHGGQPDPDTHQDPPLRLAPVAPDTQPTQPVTQAASPGRIRRRKDTQPKVAREERRDARRNQRDAARSALRKRARTLVTHATGRHYERVGFATKGRRTAAYLALMAVLICVGFMSWSGEYGWAMNVLSWSAAHSLMVPGSLDIAAVACTLLAVDLIDKGESGFAFRLLGAVFMGLGAWINWRYALGTGNVTEQAFFPLMTVLAYSMIHAVMSAARRAARRAQHGHSSRERVEPLPRFGALVWLPGLGQPKDALAAWREAVALRLAKALAATQMPGLATDEDPQRDTGTHGGDTDEDQAEEPDTQDATPPPPDLTQMGTQADAIRWVLANVSSQPLDALRHLRTHGFPEIKPQRIHDQIRRDAKIRTDTQDATSPSIDATAPDAAAGGGA